MSKYARYVWIPRILGMLSAAGSFSIIYIILSDRKRKLGRTKNRIMLIMSIFDFFQSSAMALGSIAMPRSSTVYGAIGNPFTCVTQGVFLTLGFAVPLYNTSLNIFYLLQIAYNVSPKVFATKIEPILHTISITIPVVLAITFAMLDYIQPTGGVCFPVVRPATIAYVVVIGFSFLTSISALAMICWSVLKQERSIQKYTFSGSSRTIINNGSMLDSRGTIIQAVLYSLAFFVTFLFPFILSLNTVIGGPKFQPIPMILNVLLYPLQGFWNFLLYIRPQLRHARQMSHPKKKCFICLIYQVVFQPRSIDGPRRRGAAIQRMSNRRRSSGVIRRLSSGTVNSGRSLQENTFRNEHGGNVGNYNIDMLEAAKIVKLECINDDDDSSSQDDDDDDNNQDDDDDSNQDDVDDSHNNDDSQNEDDDSHNNNDDEVEDSHDDDDDDIEKQLSVDSSQSTKRTIDSA